MSTIPACGTKNGPTQSGNCVVDVLTSSGTYVNMNLSFSTGSSISSPTPTLQKSSKVLVTTTEGRAPVYEIVKLTSSMSTLIVKTLPQTEPGALIWNSQLRTEQLPQLTNAVPIPFAGVRFGLNWSKGKSHRCGVGY